VSSLQRDLVREMGRERLDAARHRQLVGELKKARRSERRAKRRATARWWRRRPAEARVAQPALAPAPAPRPEDVTRVVAVLLDGIAERIAEHGTATERAALLAVHDVTRWSAPGAAAALVDEEGSEPARLRAFGVLHGVVLGVLGPEDRAWLLDQLRGGGAHGLGERVA
jgi:hypothetical protein